MLFRKIVKLFEDGNVCVCGLRGRGKDLLMANVASRRGLEYVCNVDYGGDRHQFNPMDYDCGKNTYREFISGKVKRYVYPWPDGTDIYISDAGVYFPAQYCNELNRDYGYFATFMALSRHLGECNVHFNAQNLNRVWDKIREQSDCYIMCNGCIVLFGKIVLQMVTLYELYDSALKRVPPFRLPRPLLNRDRQYQWEIQKSQYDIAHGSIKRKLLIYIHKSNYNTRFFKEVLENGIETDPDQADLAAASRSRRAAHQRAGAAG